MMRQPDIIFWLNGIFNFNQPKGVLHVKKQ